VASVIVLTVVMAAAAGCTGEEHPPAACASLAATLSSIDPATGDTTWQTALTRTSESPPQVFDGTVVVAGPCGVAAVDLTEGEVLYDEVPTGRSGVIGVVGDLLVLRDDSEGDRNGYSTVTLAGDAPGHSYSTNASFHGATIAGGHLITLFGSSLTSQTPGESRPDWEVALPACCHDLHVHSGNLLLLTGGDGSTYAIDLADGEVVWRTIPPLAALGYDMRVTSVRGTVLTAATTSDASERSFAYATDARTGRLRWTHPALSVLGADRQTTLLRAEEAVEAVDTRSGDLLWSHPAPTVSRDESTSTAALTSDTVVVQQTGSTATGLDRTTGRVLWDGPETTSVLAAGEVVLAVTDDGLTALDARTGAARWTSTHERTRHQVAVSPDGQLLYLDSDTPPQPAMNDCC
jgi:outer membrane protein assembly factor BamB